MSEPDARDAFESNETDRLDQAEPAIPEVADPENDPSPAPYDDEAGSEGDWLDQAEEVDIDEEQLGRG